MTFLTARIFIGLTIILTTSFCWAALADRNCLQRHMYDAIELNEHRAPIYAQASEGMSQPLSVKLVRWEKKLARKAVIADTWARAYQRAGIPVLCQDLVDMRHSPPLPPTFDPAHAPQARDFVSLSPEEMQQNLFDALSISYGELQKRAGYYLHILAHEKRLNCMTRHFLESIYKFAESSSGYLKHPQAKRFRTLNFFLRHTLKSQIKDLDLTHELDLMALPIQTQGVGILCLDVPPIVEHF